MVNGWGFFGFFQQCGWLYHRPDSVPGMNMNIIIVNMIIAIADNIMSCLGLFRFRILYSGCLYSDFCVCCGVPIRQIVNRYIIWRIIFGLLVFLVFLCILCIQCLGLFGRGLALLVLLIFCLYGLLFQSFLNHLFIFFLELFFGKRISLIYSISIIVYILNC